MLHQSNFRQKNQLTGKSLPEALILASTNSQYDDRLFIELSTSSVQENYKFSTQILGLMYFSGPAPFFFLNFNGPKFMDFSGPEGSTKVH